jgi:hypothetical protein
MVARALANSSRVIWISSKKQGHKLVMLLSRGQCTSPIPEVCIPVGTAIALWHIVAANPLRRRSVFMTKIWKGATPQSGLVMQSMNIAVSVPVERITGRQRTRLKKAHETIPEGQTNVELSG